MIAFEGNTGPYIQYANARICSILNRARAESINWDASEFSIRTAEEKQLAITLMRYPGVVAETTDQLEPHRLCTYLYELANSYSSFYQGCPVLKAEDPATVKSRLRLCELVQKTLADGLDLLGIETPSRM